MGSLRSAVLWTVASLCAFVCVEAALFRSGWYLRFLEPQSTTGQLELRLFWLKHTPRGRRQEVMALGDSRMAEGFSARTAQAAVGNRLRFWNMGVGGTSPRVWYYFIRDADPTRDRFAAIVLPLDRYYDDLNQRTVDLNYAVGRLRILDCSAFAQSGMLGGCLFKGVVLRQDIRAFLANVRARVHSSEDWLENGAGYVDGYEGKSEDVTGITADRANRRVDFPARLTQMQRFTIQETVMPPDDREPPELTRYRREWFGRILNLYKNSSTKIIFIEMPQRPLQVRESDAPTNFMRYLANARGISLIPAAMFRDLERPDLFADGLHLNHSGRPLFSARLAAQVAGVLDGR